MDCFLLVHHSVWLGLSREGDGIQPMTIFECDFCKKQKSCSKVQIDSKQFDLCAECKKSLEKKLEGRGEYKANPTGWTYYIYSQPAQQPQRPFYPNQIWYTSLGTTTGCNSLSSLGNPQAGLTASGGMLGR